MMDVDLKLPDFEICLCLSLTPTEKEQTDEVLRNEIIKVSTLYCTGHHLLKQFKILCKHHEKSKPDALKGTNLSNAVPPLIKNNNFEPYKCKLM